MHIYQLPMSLYSFKLRLALNLKGIVIELRDPPGGSYRTADYRAINPAGTIPALIDGDLMLTETDSIIEYLDDAGRGIPLLPSDIRARARTRMLSRWIDLKLETAIRSLFGSVVPSGCDKAFVASKDQVITGHLALIEEAMAETGPFMLGPIPGMADCGLVACLCWLKAIDAPLALAARPGERMARTFAALADDARLAPEIAGYRLLVDAWVSARMAA